MTRGAEFSDLQALNSAGILNNSFFQFASSPGLESGTIVQRTPNNSFRYGQQILFTIGISNPIVAGVADNWITRLKLKPWWARPNREFRQAGGGNGSPGSSAYLPVDRQAFLLTSITDNRYVWIPSPKRLDITPFSTPPPPVSEARTSDSVMLDDVWVWDLQDADSAAYQADFPAPQEPSRWNAFFYPAMGYALGFTWDASYHTTVGQGNPQPFPRVSLTWATGTLGGTNYQESLG
jgi:hypothetical protein